MLGLKGWRSLGGDAEHVQKRKEPDVLELALEEGVIGPQEEVGRRGGREAPSNNPARTSV